MYVHGAFTEASAKKAQKVLWSLKTQRSQIQRKPHTHSHNPTFRLNFTPWPRFSHIFIFFIFSCPFPRFLLETFAHIKAKHFQQRSTSTAITNHFFTNKSQHRFFLNLEFRKIVFFRNNVYIVSFCCCSKNVPIIFFYSSQIFSSSELQTSKTSTAFPTPVPDHIPHPVQGKL